MHYAMKTALVGGEWSASSSGRIIPGLGTKVGRDSDETGSSETPLTTNSYNLHLQQSANPEPVWPMKQSSATIPT
jgi:hypothetical protein